MNDEFLYQLREEPPPQFAARLKARLDRQAKAAGSKSWTPRLLRTLTAALLLGATAFAMMLPSVRESVRTLYVFVGGDDPEHAHEKPGQSDPPALQSMPVPSPRAAEPDFAPRNIGQPASAPQPASRFPIGEKAAAESVANDSLVPPIIGGGVPPKDVVTLPRRSYLHIVGSATVYSYTTSVAERFSRDSALEPPKIETNGTGGGFQQFCARTGLHSPDIVQASRRIAPMEWQMCFRNGVRDIIEIKLGHEAIVVARSRLSNSIELSRRQVFLAVAEQVPDPASAHMLLDNPFTTWSELGAKLPALGIEVLAPGLTASTRRAFEELVLDPGCEAYPWIKQLKSVNLSRYTSICHTMRNDETYQPIREDDGLLVRKLDAHPNAVAFVSFGLLRKYEKELDSNSLDGVAPVYATISAGTYPASRTLYLYVKREHVGLIPGITQFMAEYLSERAIGPEGYLAAQGLVPLDHEERERVRSAMKQFRTYTP
jgi:phosphate transport system substrate-binding protein